ncbi:DUF4139 domain-containing protein [Telmatocola sphagniphila]|uniref:DUF4139 domain-containing protein n=1 Tax=Telmatocola sphagniphila TaxID=1123043 RepID=A0A8E6EZ16_9BACT|nr:DUF4139 domain-containing protein [Telmatocola sphagniphila]QVL32951.1 DUF4139 domain-containing protein [Telmatocola sphagniphila]
MKSLRRLLWLSPVVGAVGLASWLGAQPAKSAPDVPKSELKAITTLPISRVILFSSGVGHFSRSGEVEGDARVDLTFPENDINDLIKSMVLQDYSEKGRIAAVTCDSRDPIDRTLKSFAINLNNNPSLSQILNQARGEKIEVSLQQNATSQPAQLTGSIIGIEHKKEKDQVEAEILNMWCAEGVRSIKLSELQRIRFLNPVIESEFRRALDVLALSHDSQKKAVSLHFAGEGKRKVQVSYVVENPIWKTSYRLVLDKAGKPFLQGWAVVENPTDEDWTNVSMALISGRPISFKMDLYNPIYVPRPTVEPELFASLRPPTYSGALARASKGEDAVAFAPAPMAPGAGGFAGGPGGGFGGGRGAMAKSASAADKPMAANMLGGNIANGEGSRQLQEQLRERMNLGAGISSVASASQLGDYFQYVIDNPVSLARQKSSLLPIVNKEIDGTRVSIYNPNVQAKHPLLGLKFKNTSGFHLSQGPITVFEGSTYAGDTRILDIQPNEERLVSYAVDLGTEVSAKNTPGSGKITQLKIQKGVVFTKTRFREEKVYDVVNRSTTDRTLLIEHPNRKNLGFSIVGTNKPVEETADQFRFQTAVPAGKSLSYTVAEERELGTEMVLTNSQDNQIRYVINLNEASTAVKEKLMEALSLKKKWDDTRRDIQEVNNRINTITQDQNRLRQNFRELPKESEAYKKYLKKFDEQEKEMDQLSDKLRDLQKQDQLGRVAYENYLGNLTVE